MDGWMAAEVLPRVHEEQLRAAIERTHGILAQARATHVHGRVVTATCFGSGEDAAQEGGKEDDDDNGHTLASRQAGPEDEFAHGFVKIVERLRERPVAMLRCVETARTSSRLREVARVVLYRVLSPLSTDGSSTAALLRHAATSDRSSPCFETLMRAYAQRSDVVAYFQAIWSVDIVRDALSRHAVSTSSDAPDSSHLVAAAGSAREMVRALGTDKAIGTFPAAACAAVGDDPALLGRLVLLPALRRALRVASSREGRRLADDLGRDFASDDDSDDVLSTARDEDIARLFRCVFDARLQREVVDSAEPDDRPRLSVVVENLARAYRRVAARLDFPPASAKSSAREPREHGGPSAVALRFEALEPRPRALRHCFCASLAEVKCLADVLARPEFGEIVAEDVAALDAATAFDADAGRRAIVALKSSPPPSLRSERTTTAKHVEPAWREARRGRAVARRYARRAAVDRPHFLRRGRRKTPTLFSESAPPKVGSISAAVEEFSHPTRRRRLDDPDDDDVVSRPRSDDDEPENIQLCGVDSSELTSRDASIKRVEEDEDVATTTRADNEDDPAAYGSRRGGASRVDSRPQQSIIIRNHSTVVINNKYKRSDDDDVILEDEDAATRLSSNDDAPIQTRELARREEPCERGDGDEGSDVLSACDDGDARSEAMPADLPGRPAAERRTSPSLNSRHRPRPSDGSIRAASSSSLRSGTVARPSSGSIRGSERSRRRAAPTVPTTPPSGRRREERYDEESASSSKRPSRDRAAASSLPPPSAGRSRAREIFGSSNARANIVQSGGIEGGGKSVRSRDSSLLLSSGGDAEGDEIAGLAALVPPGIRLTKHCRHSRPHGCHLSVDADGTAIKWTTRRRNSSEAELSVDEIIDVKLGLATPVFNRYGNANKADYCFSVLTRFRSLDIECASRATRNNLAAAIDFLRTHSEL